MYHLFALLVVLIRLYSFIVRKTSYYPQFPSWLENLPILALSSVDKSVLSTDNSFLFHLLLICAPDYCSL